MGSFYFLVLLLAATHLHANPQRFVLRSQRLPELMEMCHRTGVQVVRALKYSSGFVVLGEDQKVNQIAKAMPADMELDIVNRVILPNRGAVLPQNRLFSQQTPWGIERISAVEVHRQEKYKKGEGAIVCISDTGIDLDHPDLKDRILTHFNVIDPARGGEDDNGHGTHVAGIVAASDNGLGVVGVAPRAQLIAAKALDGQGAGFSSDLSESIDECRERGAAVINLSWGSAQKSELIEEAIRRAFDAGIFVVAAAGNEASGVLYPAALPQTIAVSAIDQENRLAVFSNYGSEIFTSAPGVDIVSTWLEGVYRPLSGTSMAAPHVSGVAALLVAERSLRSGVLLRGVPIGLPREKQGVVGRIDALITLMGLSR